jgi:hypothetical protein
VKVRLLVAAALLALPIGGACSDDCGSGTPDCGEALGASWSPGSLPDAPVARLCVADACNNAEPPYLNEVTGDLHAPSWIGELPEGEVTVRLELLGDDQVPIETLETVVEADEQCGCRTVNLSVADRALVED